MDLKKDTRTQVAEWARQAVHTKLASNRTLAGVCNAMVAVNTICDRAIEKLVSNVPDNAPLACRKGCGHCCNATIATWPLEAIFAAAHAQLTFSPEGRRELGKRIAARPTPCPFLVDGSCGIYEARMGICHQYYSFDLNNCLKDTYPNRNPRAPFDRANLTALIYSASRDGVGAACRELGLQHGMMSMHSALVVMSRDPKALERWLQGEAVFPLLPRPTTGDGARMPQ